MITTHRSLPAASKMITHERSSKLKNNARMRLLREFRISSQKTAEHKHAAVKAISNTTVYLLPATVTLSRQKAISNKARHSHARSLIRFSDLTDQLRLLNAASGLCDHGLDELMSPFAKPMRRASMPDTLNTVVDVVVSVVETVGCIHTPGAGAGGLSGGFDGLISSWSYNCPRISLNWN